MNTIQAVVADAGSLSLRAVEQPKPKPDEVLVRVAAISLNRGEVRRSLSAQTEYRPGWDLAGIVEKAAADGSGPAAGTRVVGLLRSGAWAELVAVHTRLLSELPPEVSFAQAATLPVAGLTALQALEKGGNLLERKVLVTGASGGVGYYAVQLARQAGAHVIGVVRQETRVALVREAGAHEVVISEDASAAGTYGPYYHIVDGVGGNVLANALSMLSPNGMCVAYGSTAGNEVTFSLGRFFGTGGLRLYGFILFHELEYEPASVGLGRLARMIVDGRLHPYIEVEAKWTEIASVAQRLLDRDFAGKAVLHIAS